MVSINLFISVMVLKFKEAMQRQQRNLKASSPFKYIRMLILHRFFADETADAVVEPSEGIRR